MQTTAEKAMEHIGETCGISNHDHDLIHELSKRLDALWRFDQYIANADPDDELQQLWRDFKEQEKGNVARLKKLVAKHCQQHCFD